ncbi:hypothetical protein PanWU01x14_058880 [Parasponia andersonii]|uniref:Uncharacterized protein n=1 Tax=Parasponia andersonii TaxID=3476 RepID=A0A2P5DJA5_PARAD|nr:hypothetical protein PanWU01x14_058880 [Parasponia andersonii]
MVILYKFHHIFRFQYNAIAVRVETIGKSGSKILVSVSFWLYPYIESNFNSFALRSATILHGKKSIISAHLLF